jgi:hypothetical protein
MQLDRVGDEMQVVEGAVVETARELLDAALPHVREAIAQADERREMMLDEAERKLTEAVELLAGAGALGAEAVWLGRLAVTGEVAPYGRGVSTFPRGYGETRDALHRVIEGRATECEQVVAAERDRETADLVSTAGGAPRRLPLPPNAETWVMPGEGESVEAEAEPEAVAVE